jgi:hypothetical protein
MGWIHPFAIVIVTLAAKLTPPLSIRGQALRASVFVGPLAKIS